MPIDWPEFERIIQENERFVLTSHLRPDCDALGSELGMAAVLKSLGKQVTIVNPHPTPANLAFIDPEEEIQVLGEHVQGDELIDSPDVLMVLDTTAWAQLGKMGDVIRNTEATKIVLDHHVGGDDLGAILFKDTTAEATGRLVADAAERLGVKLTPQVAASLFAALATDTGWFRFRSTTAETYRLAGKLADAGADPQSVYCDLYEQDTLGRVKLRGRILERFTSEMNGRLVHTYVRQNDFQETGALPPDTEDAINMGLTITGSEVAVILVEQPEGGCKISFRSQCDLNCNDLASQFGGGGHKAAAGAFLREPFKIAQEKILNAVRKAMG